MNHRQKLAEFLVEYINFFWSAKIMDYISVVNDDWQWILLCNISNVNNIEAFTRRCCSVTELHIEFIQPSTFRWNFVVAWSSWIFFDCKHRELTQAWLKNYIFSLYQLSLSVLWNSIICMRKIEFGQIEMESLTIFESIFIHNSWGSTWKICLGRQF